MASRVRKPPVTINGMVAAGAMAPELLGSLNVRPAALLASGYTFLDPDLESLLETALSE